MISFYVPSDEYGFLCNFSRHGFLLRDRYWPTVEHYFQAQKFAGNEFEERIRLAATPNEAKKLGQTREPPIRLDWDDVKVKIMSDGLNAKFRAHRKLAEALLATKDQQIVENAPDDFFWGCGRDSSGKNMLGMLLMELRSDLRNQQDLA